MKLIIFSIIFCGLFLARIRAEDDFPISYLCSSCVLYDTDIGDVFDDLDELTVRGPRPQENGTVDTTQEAFNATFNTLFNTIMVDVDGKYVSRRNETMHMITYISTTVMLTLTVSIMIGLGNIVLILFLLTPGKTVTKPKRALIRVQETDN